MILFKKETHSIANEVSDEIKRIMDKKISEYQEQEIKKLLNKKYVIFERPKKDMKNGVLWRLSIIPLFLIIVLIALIMPVKWLITGELYYSPESKFMKMLWSWGEKT